MWVEIDKASRSKKSASLSEDILVLIANRFKVLSELTRLKLIIALQNGEKNVSELVRTVGATQANTSCQLQILTEAGILRRRKAGLNVFYSIADPTIFSLCDHVCHSLENRVATQSKLFEE